MKDQYQVLNELTVKPLFEWGDEFERFKDWFITEGEDLESICPLPMDLLEFCLKEDRDYFLSTKGNIEDLTEIHSQDLSQKVLNAKLPPGLQRKFYAESIMEWCLTNWGTAGINLGYEMPCEIEKDRIAFTFWSSYLPPTSLIQKLSFLFPKLSFTLKCQDLTGGFDAPVVEINYFRGVSESSTVEVRLLNSEQGKPEIHKIGLFR